MLINYFLIALSGLFFSTFLMFILERIALKKNLLVFKGIPHIGGIASVSSFVIITLVSFLSFGKLPPAVIGVVIASLVMLIFGVIDDWKELSVPNKFFVQIICVSLVVMFGIKTQIVYIGTIFNIILTFIWILGITNAMNHLDVMDGLAGGTAVIVSLSFFLISLLNSDQASTILSLACLGSALGFWLHNLPPARAYLGNAGSHTLGFILALIAIMISYAPLERKVALFSPILILGFPIFDSAFLILMRVVKGRSIFKKSNDHLALRFLKLHRSKKKSLLVMLSLALSFSLCGVLVSRISNNIGILVILMAILLSIFITKKMSRVMVDE